MTRSSAAAPDARDGAAGSAGSAGSAGAAASAAVAKSDDPQSSGPDQQPSSSQSAPLSTPPPAANADLPTPPTSHNEFRPPPNPVASSSRLNQDDQLPDASPITTTASENMAPRRAAARLSGGSSSFDRNAAAADDSFSSSQRRASRRSSIDRNDDRSFAAERPLGRGSYRSRATPSPSRSPARSLTPSPILGPVFADLPRSLRADRADRDDDHDDYDDEHDALKLGHLSFPMLGVGVGPTKDEIELLVYGTNAANKHLAEPPSPTEDSASIETMLTSLANMGLDPLPQSSASDRERELAGMVKRLAERCTTLSDSRNRAQSQLKSTRLTALSVISSMKQAHAHALAAHRNTTDRLDAELDGWKAQAKMLSALLNRAEARGFDERRSALNSASLVTFADRAKAAAPNSSPHHNRLASFKSEAAATSNADSAQRILGSPSLLSSSHEAAAAAVTASPGTTGLGITSTGLAEVDTDLSPAASLLRERNKLLTDKKHLKARVRDAEAQVYKLENELKALRPYLVSGGIKSTDLPALASNPDSAAAVVATPGDISQPGTAPTTPSRSGSRRDKNRKKRIVTMGDAETEHLMLAARRLRELRKEQAAAASSSASPADSASLPASQARDATSNGVLAPAAELHAAVGHASPIKRQASEGPMASVDSDALYPREPHTPPTRSAERPPKTPKSVASIPNTPRTGMRARELNELARGDDRRDSWSAQHRRLDSASSFTGIDELLQAAETLNPGAAAPSPTRSRAPTAPFPPASADPGYYPREAPHRAMPYPPPPPQLAVNTQRGADYDSYGYSAAPYPIQSSPLRMAHESPKRRRVSSAAFDFEPYGSPFLGERQPRVRTQTEGADPFAQPRPYRDYGPSGPPSAGGSQALSALDLLADQATASQNPSQGSDKSADYEGVSPIGSLSSEDEMTIDGEPRRKSGSRSVGSRAQDGSRKNGSQGSSSRASEGKSFGGNQNPEKRLPYVRWTAEEDTKLRAAIKEHGQRWELISRAVGTRSYHQCRQRYLLMRRKEAAAKAQADADDGGQGLSASASDQQSQDSDYGHDAQMPSSSNRRKSGSHVRRASRGSGGADGEAGATSTPLHKLSIGAPAPAGSVYGQFSPTPRQEALPAPSSQTPTHARMMSHPHAAGPLSPSMQPSSPYSSQTPSAVRRAHYPPPSPLSTSSRQLPPLHPPPQGYSSHGPAPASPHLGGHRRQVSGDARQPPPASPTTPTSGARRMGAALYS